MSTENTFDIVVIGGGSGGSAFSRRAASYGARVCIVDKGPLRDASGKRIGAGFGGTCVNVGCVPKKIMYLAANGREDMVGGNAAGLGISAGKGAGAVDWAGLKERRDAYVAGLNKSYESNWTKAGIEIILGEASFVGPKTVRVCSSDGTCRSVSGKQVLICVGGVPAPLAIPGGELAIDSDGFFDVAEQPKKVAILGAGYIAVEMAGIFHGLGSEAHLFYRGKTVLRHGFEPYIVETLMEQLTKHGPALHGECSPAKISKASDGTLTLSVTSSTGLIVEHTGFDCILSAIGRKPSTGDPLGLKLAGVETEKKSGLIKVDPYENTSAPGVYAIGDATTTGYELTPVAIAAGRRLADRLFGGEARARIEYANIATVVFSHPPIGMIGLAEPQAKAEYGTDKIVTKQARFASMMYALNKDADSKVKTALKLVLLLPEERVVGLHCIGPHSDEMIQGFAVAVRMGATRADFEAAVAIHPTISEEFVTFGGWGQEKLKDGKMIPQLPPYLRVISPGMKQAVIGFVAGVAAAALVAAAASRRR